MSLTNRRTRWRKLRACLLAPLLLAAALPTTAARGSQEANDQAKSVIVRALEEEMQRAKEILARKGSPPPYFIGYEVTEDDYALVSASYGALRVSTSSRVRLLDVDVRAGDYQLDSTHRTGDEQDPYGGALAGYESSVQMPVEDDVDALKSVIWLKTDEQYKDAVERLTKIKAERPAKVAEEDHSADFSRETPQVASLPLARRTLDAAEWEPKVREVSAVFKKHPEVYASTVLLTDEAINKYLVNSEGASVQHGHTQLRLVILATTKADDGMDLFRYESFDAATPDRLPAVPELLRAAEKVATDLEALRKAPAIEPYTGPAILSGRASGVFFHEIFGHRVEGHRQKGEAEGNTFTKRVNLPVLPRFLSVYDDPTVERYAGVDLSGAYQFDDEGVKARRVPVVEAGLLKNFLMSRSPVNGFEESNGHGRRFPGFAPVGRQGNLIVEAARPVTRERLRQMLIAECRRQGKQFGLLFDDVVGGFTLTQRATPQAFEIMPVMVYKVYVDGRPDQLVRGVDLIGTPLTSFSKIIAADDHPEVFNGACGAESGPVAVSAVSPGILTAQIEVQKRQKSSELPPVLPPPAWDKAATEQRKGN